MPQPPAVIDSFDALAARYPVILSDVWGVVHNGVSAHLQACEALRRVREAGKPVVLVTNSPRPRDAVVEQMRQMGVPDESWDEVVTSGDVTRELIREAPRRLFHIGPDRDQSIYDGIDVELVEEFEAAGVVCTGLYDDETETPEDYTELLRRLRMRDLPFICANPDIVVERGDRLIFCAGALAREYGLMGGRTLIAGKPYPPIYEAALATLAPSLPLLATRISVIAPRHSTCVPTVHTSAERGFRACRARARSSQSRCCATNCSASRNDPRNGITASAVPSRRSVSR